MKNTELLNLGRLYVSDFCPAGQGNLPEAAKYELKLILDPDGAARLEKMAPSDQMWGQKYWYRSSITQTMKNALRDVVKSITNLYSLKENDIWVDIASNDLTLLGFVPSNLIRIGIDPVSDPTYLVNATTNSNLVIQDYFSASVYRQSTFGSLPAKVVTCISMFYDVEENKKFLRDIHNILDDDGICVIQMSYTPLMLQQMAFDNICHEHCYYYSLFNFQKIAQAAGFKIMDCTLNDVNSGSFRIFLMKEKSNEKLFGSQPFRDVARFRVNSLLQYESTLKLDQVETWQKYFSSINLLKDKLTRFINQEKASGKTIYGYGASTKFNTLLQYFNLDHAIITKVAEREPRKWGLETVGTQIPICSEQEMRKDHPDYLIIGPWHFINEFREREKEYLEKGGKFIVPCPKLEIVGASGVESL